MHTVSDCLAMLIRSQCQWHWMRISMTTDQKEMTMKNTIGSFCATVGLFFLLLFGLVQVTVAAPPQETLTGDFVRDTTSRSADIGSSGTSYRPSDGSTWTLRVYKADELSITFADTTLRSGQCTASGDTTWKTRYSGMNAGNLSVAMTAESRDLIDGNGPLKITCTVSRSD